MPSPYKQQACGCRKSAVPLQYYCTCRHYLRRRCRYGLSCTSVPTWAICISCFSKRREHIFGTNLPHGTARLVQLLGT
jgi:hypothetical protein